MLNHIRGGVPCARHHGHELAQPASGPKAAVDRELVSGTPPDAPARRLPASPASDQLQAPRRSLLPAQLPTKTGACASKANTAEGSLSSSSSASSSMESPARPSTSVFEYRTAELSQANVEGICVGLTAEWLLRLNSGASDRVAALRPGSENHSAAATRQQQYQELKASLRRQGAASAEADLEAQNAMLRAAGLTPSGKEKKYRYGEPSSFSRMLDKISVDGSTHLLSLYFAEGTAHTIGTSASRGMTTLFDPNYGEFTVRSSELDSLFQSLGNRYRNPNGQHLSTVTTQAIY